MKTATIVGLVLVCTAGVAHAHEGGGAHDIADGLAHPLTGLDHLLAAVALGLFVAQRGGRATWALPAAFLLAMVAGGVATAAGVAVPAVEPTLLASVLVLGAAVAAAARPPLALAAGVAALLAFAHGAAHAGEASGAAAFAGLTATTAGLVGAGLAAGAALRAFGAAGLLRVAGAATAVAGALLLAA